MTLLSRARWAFTGDTRLTTARSSCQCREVGRTKVVGVAQADPQRSVMLGCLTSATPSTKADVGACFSPLQSRVRGCERRPPRCHALQGSPPRPRCTPSGHVVVRAHGFRSRRGSQGSMILVHPNGARGEREQAIDEQGCSPADEHPRPGKQTTWYLWAARVTTPVPGQMTCCHGSCELIPGGRN